MSYPPPPPSGSAGWQPPAGEPYPPPAGGYQPPSGGYQQPADANQAPSWENQTPGSSHQPPAGGPWQQPTQAGGWPSNGFGTRPDERNWAMAAHIGCLAAGLFFGLAFVAPLIVLLTKGNESPFIRRHAVESLNFQITMIIVALVAFVLSFVLIGFFIWIAQAIFWLIVVIMATVAASNGQEYRYPLTLRLVS